MVRSRKLTLTDWTAANNALMQYFEGNKSKLSSHVNMSRTTITNFFNQQPVGENSFRKICLALGLNWQKYSSVNLASDSSDDRPSELSEPNEALIEQTRQRCRQKILERHSRMRLWSGQEIGVDQLYVDVWLLEKPESIHFNTSESLLSNFDIEKDRLALSKRIRRNPGFEIANSKSKLVILGKPGSGKTTFLKHLAVDWCKGKFQTDSIAIMLELRRIQDSQWDIWSILGQELELNYWHQFAIVKKEISKLRKQQSAVKDERKYLERSVNDLEQQLKSFPLHHFLEQGRLLILMDGLDELATNKLRHTIQDQLREVSQDYPKNRLILTCRTQIMEVIPSGFTLLEVADFSPEQIRQFVLNWFMANGRTEAEANELWKTVHCATTNRPDLGELTVTPVLLSLMCLVLQDERGKIPTDRGWLYKKGIKLLLSRWNDEKAIEDWEIGTGAYRRLSIDDKEALLIKIAARKFENPRNFILFEQDDLVEQIIQELKLANTRDGTGVLRAIEAQHGLLIERADELWSFSHLTFQEYFTVQWLTKLPSQKLAEKISNQRWQKIVKQLVKSQQPADQLLRCVKQATDQLVGQEHAIQIFLGWSFRKSGSLKTSYKPAVIRAFYCSNYHDIDLDLARVLTRTLIFNKALVLAQALDCSLDIDRILELTFEPACTCLCNHDLDFNLDRSLTFVLALARALTCALALDLNSAYTLDCAFGFILDLAHILDLSPNLISCLHQLKSKLPTSNRAKETESWWSSHGAQWIKKFQQVIIEYRNIGHDWQFTQEQQQQLHSYYEANIFLVGLMKIEGAVSEECRIEIEDGLLLPWAELQRRQPHLYGELQE